MRYLRLNYAWDLIKIVLYYKCIGIRLVKISNMNLFLNVATVN